MCWYLILNFEVVVKSDEINSSITKSYSIFHQIWKEILEKKEVLLNKMQLYLILLNSYCFFHRRLIKPATIFMYLGETDLNITHSTKV